MALAEGKSNGNKVKVEKKKEKKQKKQKTEVKLPNARRSIRRQRQMAQGKADYNDMWTLIGALLVVGLVLFILFGGINQRAFWETMKDMGDKIGQTVSEWINPDQVIFTDDGIYVDPDGDGQPGTAG